MRRTAGFAMLLALLGAGPGRAATVVYDNTNNASTEYYTGQAGAEAVDDLHGVGAGVLTGIRFGYRDPAATGTTFGAEITIYDNPGGLDANLVRVYGPVTVNNLAEGVHTVVVPTVGGPSVGPDLWVGVRFTSTTAGLLLNDAPLVGTSHDYYWEGGQLYYFGGAPVANFSLAVDVDGAVTGTGPVENALSFTLGSIRPNPAPAGRGARVAFTLDRPGPVRIDLLDARGRLVRTVENGERSAGAHDVWIPTRDLAGGIYFVRLGMANQSRTSRMVVLD